MELQPGTQLPGYQILELIGRGGQSTVYKAMDAELQRVVAIKFLSEGTMTGEQPGKRFQVEARTLSSLNHPSIATIFHTGRFQDVPYIVMEYVEGQDLATYSLKLTVDQRIELVRQVADAVEFAHRKGIIHRDLKPSNVLVTAEGRVKLLDFGLAKVIKDATRDRLGVVDDLTATGQVLGTVSYLSPEQARGEPLDERSDLFSLGVILFEILSGKHPFIRDSTAATLLSIVSDPPRPSLDTLGLPGNLEYVVSRLLEKDAEKRYQSASELRADLDRLRDASGAARSTIRLPQHRPPRLQLRRASKLAIAFAVAAVAIAGAGLAWRWYRGTRSAQVRPGRTTVFVAPIKGGADEKSRYLAELITGEVIATLCKSPDLRILYVTEGSGAERDSTENVLQKQPVQYVIDGNILLNGEDLRASVKILDRRDSTIVWSETIGGRISDVYSIPAKISSAVAFVTGVYVAAEKFEFPGKDAFEYYTRGDLQLRTYDPNQLPEAIRNLRRCVELAPRFAPAYERLGFAYVQYRNMGLDYGIENLQQGRDYFLKGLDLDPGSPGLLIGVAGYLIYIYDIEQAERRLAESIRLNPGQYRHYTLRAWTQFSRGQPHEALRALGQARELNPFDPVPIENLIVFNSMLGNRGAVEAAYRDMLSAYASEFVRDISEGWWRLGRDDTVGAVEVLRSSYQRTGHKLLALCCAEAEFAAGEYDACTEHLEIWLKNNPYSMESYWLLCLTHAIRGDEEERRRVAWEGLRHCETYYNAFHSPALRVYSLYFGTLAGRGDDATRQEIKRLDPDQLDTFSRYLAAATLAYLGDKEALAQPIVPYNPIFWVNRFYQKEIELLSCAPDP